MPSFRRIILVAGATVCALLASAVPQAQAAPQRAHPPARWQVAHTLQCPPYDPLAVITAAGRSDTWAFGCSLGDTAQALHWNGSTWTTSHPFGNLPPVQEAASSGPRNVWVTGNCNQYVSRWNGRRWTTTTATLSLPSCVSAVVTTGPDNTWLFTGYEPATTAMHFNGTRWHTDTLGNFGAVVAASAVSARDIWLLTLTMSGRTLLVHFNGRTWEEARVPAPSLPRGDVLVPQALTTGSDGSVWATVQIITNQGMSPAGPPDSLLLRGAGRSWTWIRLPGSDQAWPAIASDGASGVWVVGARLLGDSGAVDFYFLHWTGRGWTAQLAPTRGIPATGIVTEDVFSLARVQGTRSVLACGQVGDILPSGAPASTGVIYGYGRP